MIKLNLARNCLRYLIRLYNIKKIHVPYYSCPAVWHAIRQEKCEIKFYHISKDFLPTADFPPNEFILYINYFGMCDTNCTILSRNYKKLIVDNTHAFYSKPLGIACFNSLRKFFPVQNGAYLYVDKVLDEFFEKDDFLFLPADIERNYEQFVKNENILNSQNIKYIYPEIEQFMRNFNYEEDKKLRLEQFQNYQKQYGQYNKIKLTPKGNEIPYCYPISTDNQEILTKLNNSDKTFLALWGKIEKGFEEYDFLNNTVALPIGINFNM